MEDQSSPVWIRRLILHSKESLAMGRFHIFTDGGGAYRWRLVAPNGKIIADSGEGYTSKQSCLEGIAAVKAHAQGAEIVTDTPGIQA